MLALMKLNRAEESVKPTLSTALDRRVSLARTACSVCCRGHLISATLLPWESRWQVVSTSMRCTAGEPRPGARVVSARNSEGIYSDEYETRVGAAPAQEAI